MKRDWTKKTTRGAQRTLDAFTAAMLDVLAGKPFEQITVNELCEKSNYPRATFYNYFDDKYDLLHYVWHCLNKQIRLEQYEETEPEQRLFVLFDRAYDFIEAHQGTLNRIIKHNAKESFLLFHFRVQLGDRVRAMFDPNICRYRDQVPHEIIADHYCNTVLLVLEWRFLHGNDGSKEDTLRYLEHLLGALNAKSSHEF